MSNTRAYKVMTSAEFTAMKREGVFRGSPVDLASGFIHMSARDQLAATIDKHFHGQPDLVIATVELTVLGDAVRWEPSRGGQLFPHLYGVLPMNALVAADPIERSPGGALVLPTRNSSVPE